MGNIFVFHVSNGTVKTKIQENKLQPTILNTSNLE